MEREDSYEALCEAQRTPYLQWLKEQNTTPDTVNRGKRIKRLPFLSCEDSFLKCLEQGGISLETQEKTEDILWLFYTTDGIMDERAEAVFANAADADILYADEDYQDGIQGERCNPWFKPEYSPDTLRSFFYYGSIFALNSSLACRVWKQLCWETGRENDTNVSIYEFLLYASGQTQKIIHIPQVLYTSQNINKMNQLPGQNMQWCAVDRTNWWRQFYGKEIRNVTQVSIIIPSKDNGEVLLRCLNTLLEKTAYPQYEIIIVDNGSSPEHKQWITLQLEQLRTKYMKQIQYLYESQPFNFSRMCNQGASAAKGRYVLFLNDDMEIIEKDWLGRMLELAVQFHTGAVGARLLYPKASEDENYRIQHVGITNMGIGPAHKLAGMEDVGNLYHGHNLVNYDMIAVTGACLLLDREKFLQVQGFDEELAVAYNDVELCFKLYEKGYFNIVCNEAMLLHHESFSRGQDDTDEKKKRLAHELSLLYSKHPDLCGTDPFYSPNLVQWKKDVTYACNYLYPSDKEADPVLCRERLPRVHHNRWIRKLTGENLSMLEIDHVEQTQEFVEIEGWYVLREHDNAGLRRWLLLKHEQRKEVYQVPLYPKLREDVESLFAQDASTTRTALTGIHAVIRKQQLPEGSYMIGILVQDETAGGSNHGKRIQYAQGRGFLL